MLTLEEKIQWKKKERLLKRKRKSGKIIQDYEKKYIGYLNLKRTSIFERISWLIKRIF